MQPVRANNAWFPPFLHSETTFVTSYWFPVGLDNEALLHNTSLGKNSFLERKEFFPGEVFSTFIANSNLKDG